VAATLPGDGTLVSHVCHWWKGSTPSSRPCTDGAGNAGTAQVVVRRDTYGAATERGVAADGAVVNDRQPIIQIAYDDGGTGLAS